MEKYTLRDLVSGKCKLLSDFDIVWIDDVERVSVITDGKSRVVKIHVGPYDYFFNRELKAAIKTKITSDLNSGTNTKYKFAI